MVQELFLINLEKENYREITCFCLRADRGINPFPHDKILDQTELNAFADNKLNVTKMIILALIEKKTLWEKEKLLVQAISSFSRNVFQKASFPHISKVIIVWELVRHSH